MQLHKDSGQLRVIIDVSYSSEKEFINFIENEQCQFLESLGVDGLLKFEWYVDVSTNTATLIEEFTDVASFQELATSVNSSTKVAVFVLTSTYHSNLSKPSTPKLSRN